MNLSSQVTSLELSKKLKELGVEQESLFYWIRELDPYIWYNSMGYPMKVEKYYYSAFTASELLEILPTGHSVYKSSCNNYITYNQHTLESKCFKDNNICDSLAKLLIYLLENNFNQVNKGGDYVEVEVSKK